MRLKAIGEEAIKQIKLVELTPGAIEKGVIKILPDVMVSDGGLMGSRPSTETGCSASDTGSTKRAASKSRQ